MKSIDRRTALKFGALAAVTPAFAQLAGCAQSGGSSSGSGSSASSSSGSAPQAYTIDNIRQFIVGVDQPISLEDGSTKAAICFDNAATTPALKPVLDQVNADLLTYASIERGFSQKSDLSTERCFEVRDKVLEFVGAEPGAYTCYFAATATDGLNKLATALITDENMVVLATRAEHHSNDLPWRARCKVIYAEVDEKGRIIYDDFERLLSENKVDYVTVTAASNVTGYVTDVHRVAKMAHAHGAKIVVDGAQIVAHRQFSMKGATHEEDIDFFAFSAHKMYAPFGGGAVVGLFDVLNEHMPEFYGGGIVSIVADDWARYKLAPEKYEAGSPNFVGITSLGKAIDVLREVGFDAIQKHEQVLIRKMMDGLTKIDKLIIYGDTQDTTDRVGVITFNHPEVNTFVLAMRLANSYGIATRRGAFCAHPYVWRLMDIPAEMLEGFSECTDVNTPGMVRVSFGIYNTEAEVDEFLKILPEAIEKAREDQERYSRAEPAY